MSEPNDGYAPRFGPRVRTYEQEYQADIDRLERELAEREAECARLRAELELERRKNHAYMAWTQGYQAAMGDYVAGRTALWPARAVSDPAGTAPSEAGA